jgi:hypothetical protein
VRAALARDVAPSSFSLLVNDCASAVALITAKRMPASGINDLELLTWLPVQLSLFVERDMSVAFRSEVVKKLIDPIRSIRRDAIFSDRHATVWNA